MRRTDGNRRAEIALGAGEALSNLLRFELEHLWTRPLEPPDRFVTSVLGELRRVMRLFFRMAGVRACRYCGCTQNTACDTDDGGCSWIAADVCSALPCARARTAARKQGRRR